MAAWRDEILAGVESVKYHGCVPGYIIVYGDNSDAILTNENGETLIAAGELGQGRVVVFSHNTFTKSYLKPELPKENETLLLNVKAWVTKGKNTVAVDVDGTNCFDKIPANGFLVWSGKEKDDTFLNKMADWIRNGGGLVCGTCPWGYAQVTGTAIENMPLNFIMSKLGMNYATCEEYFSTSNELSVHVNCAEFARLDKVVDLVKSGGDVCKVKKILSNISSTLHEVWQRRLRAEKAASLKEKHATTTAAFNWRDEILAGVESVKYQGCVPGYIIVYGDNSDAILTNETGETLIAAGELGQGRVVVFSHNTFTKSYLKPELPKKNETLLLNVKAWVTRRKDTVAVDVDGINCFDKIPANGFLVWSGEEKDDTFLNKMADWIRNGGGLVCGTCPWGYAQVTGTAIENMPLNFIMSKLGMNYATCDDYFSTSNELSVHVNCAEFARLDKAVDLMQAGGDMCKVKKTLGNISSIPHEVWLQRVQPAIDSFKQEWHCIPTKDKKTAGTKEKLAATMLCNLMIKRGLAGEPVVAEGCKEFPGDFDEPPRLEVTTIEIIGKEHQYVPTGCYLPAGMEMCLSWEKDGASNASGWSVVIGAHTDQLFGVEGAWRRWPKVSTKRTLEINPLKICSPFGGLVYMVSPKAPSHLTVTLRNIVPAPRFTFETSGSWDLERRKPGLWTDISGDLITFTMPSKSIRQLNDPCPTMRLWDEVVKAHMELRGCDPSQGRGQWVVTDEQPSCGYMHSGYPIVTHLDVADPTHEHGNHFLMNGDGIVNPRGHGFWGLFHELGHNFQHGFWTWAGTGEVTVNIFTLHAMDTLCKLKPWIHPWLAGHMSEVKAYLQGGADFEKWKSDPGVALTIYAQQARDFGWGPFKTVFREYEALPTSEQPNNYEEKIRQWIVRFSRATGRNLCPAFEFWGFPCTDEAKGFLGDLPPYLPADETTLKMAPDRAREISVKYNVI